MGETVKHTPAPWIVDRLAVNGEVVVRAGNEVAYICMVFCRNKEHDARLISAAPDMLAALGPMRTALQKQVDLLRFQARNSPAGLARTLIETAERWQALCDNAEAAITKAAGLANV